MRMAWIAIVLCLLVAAVGAIGVLSPGALLRIARPFQTPSRLYAAAALRILLGGAPLRAAPTSRAESDSRHRRPHSCGGFNDALSSYANAQGQAVFAVSAVKIRGGRHGIFG